MLNLNAAALMDAPHIDAAAAADLSRFIGGDGPTFTDFFCGAGGSSLGLWMAGFRLWLAANHWDVAIATHSGNFTESEHLCEDLDKYDMRRLKRTQVLWASVICTEGSPAGGTKKQRGGDGSQLGLFDGEGHISEKGWERTRATARASARLTWRCARWPGAPSATKWSNPGRRGRTRRWAAARSGSTATSTCTAARTRAGTPGEQTVQAGNAVSVNAACFLGQRLRPVLDAA